MTARDRVVEALRAHSFDLERGECMCGVRGTREGPSLVEHVAEEVLIASGSTDPEVIDLIEARLHRKAAALTARHAGVVWGISHPGPSPLGCTYCIDTLRQPVSVDDGRRS